ncbi:MAG: MarR family transcriptional regulator [Acholeplasmataceae bacterium]|nr:MarR family transcriptional regulator [Acholeplasmataceae bacterium]
MSHDKEYLKLTTVLFRAMQNVETVIKNDISSYQLNTSEFGVLELLYNRGKQPIQSIANRMLMANSSMTYVIDKLEQKNMISRTQDDIDKRITMIDLTMEGHHFFKGIFPNHVKTLGNIYQCLSPEELNELIESLKKIGYHAMEMNGVKK